VIQSSLVTIDQFLSGHVVVMPCEPNVTARKVVSLRPGGILGLASESTDFVGVVLEVIEGSAIVQTAGEAWVDTNTTESLDMYKYVYAVNGGLVEVVNRDMYRVDNYANRALVGTLSYVEGNNIKVMVHGCGPRTGVSMPMGISAQAFFNKEHSDKNYRLLLSYGSIPGQTNPDGRGNIGSWLGSYSEFIYGFTVPYVYPPLCFCSGINGLDNEDDVDYFYPPNMLSLYPTETTLHVASNNYQPLTKTYHVTKAGNILNQANGAFVCIGLAAG